MSRFRFELATEADDADLRLVLRETPMEGRIRIAFEREPSWFAAAVVDGDERQVVACREVDSGRIIGFGCRSLRRVYVDGRPQCVGYLSGLRVLPAFRKRGLVARGYAYFRQLHADARTPYYLTTIAEGNAPALNTLTSARAGLPRYAPAGKYHTLAIPCVTRRRAVNCVIRPATHQDLPAVFELLHQDGACRQFFPVIGAQDFGPAGMLRGLNTENLLVAEQAGSIVGLVGVWDQHAFKQSVVISYRGVLNWTRRPINFWARLRSHPQLPAIGQPFRFLAAALTVVRNDSPHTFEALLHAAAQPSPNGLNSHLLVGLHERDPLLPVAKRMAVACYTTQLYVVGWDDDELARALSSERVPYLELGTL